MPKKVKPIPKGYRSITAYLCMKGAADAIRFYKKVFGAKELLRMPAPGGTIGHAELLIGDTKIMLADEFPSMGFVGPTTGGVSPVSLHLYVKDVDKIFVRAIRAGAKEKRAVADQFYGDRLGVLEDPFGHVWSIATHVEDVSEKEMKRRGKEAMKNAGG